MWVELSHVGVHNQYNETCVKELTKEGSFDDGTFLLRYSILTNPRYKQDYALFQNGVNGNDDNGNG